MSSRNILLPRKFPTRSEHVDAKTAGCVKVKVRVVTKFPPHCPAPPPTERLGGLTRLDCQQCPGKLEIKWHFNVKKDRGREGLAGVRTVPGLQGTSLICVYVPADTRPGRDDCPTYYSLLSQSAVTPLHSQTRPLYTSSTPAISPIQVRRPPACIQSLSMKSKENVSQ